MSALAATLGSPLSEQKSFHSMDSSQIPLYHTAQVRQYTFEGVVYGMPLSQMDDLLQWYQQQENSADA